MRGRDNCANFSKYIGSAIIALVSHRQKGSELALRTSPQTPANPPQSSRSGTPNSPTDLPRLPLLTPVYDILDNTGRCLVDLAHLLPCHLAHLGDSFTCVQLRAYDGLGDGLGVGEAGGK